MGMMEEEEQSATWWERFKIKITTWGQEERTAGACRIYRPACIYTIAIEPPLRCHATTAQVKPFQWSYREKTQHLLGPIWIQKSLRSSTILYFSADRPKCAKFPLFEMRTYVSFGLILRDIPNSRKIQNTLRLLPIPVGLLVLPCTRQCRRLPLIPYLFFPVPDRGTGVGRYLCPWHACATTACVECAR